MRRAFQWGAVFALALVLTGIGAFAQSTGGALTGKITDDAGQPIPGAIIRVEGPSLQGFQGAATDVEGVYRVPFLPVGKNYSVKVEASGYNTVVRKGIEVGLGSTTNLPFQLSQGGTTVNVVGSAPVVDQRKTESGATISDTMVNAITLDRNSSRIAYLAPSAVESGLADAPAIGGASGPENAYVVNGVDVTGSGDALNLTSLNFDFIEATEVKTGGMDAEWGAVMGGAINSVTKSGSNEFHGGLFMYYWDDGLGAKERGIRNPTSVNYIKGQKIWDVGGFLGGYFVKDKLWFFVAYDYNKEERDYTANGTDERVFLNGQPSYSWARNSGYQNTYKDPQWAFKLTYNASQNHRLVFSAFGNNNKVDSFRNANNPGPIAAPTSDKTDNYALSLQWNATWTPKFFSEMIVSRRHTKDQTVPKNSLAMNSWGYYYRYGSGTYSGFQVIPTGPPTSYAAQVIDLGANWTPSLGGRTYQYTKDVNDQLRLKFTNLFSAAGRHELSYGFQFYDINYDYDFNYTGPGVTGAHTDLYDPSTGEYVANPWLGRTSASGAVVRWQYAASYGYRYRAQTFFNNQAKKTTQKYYAYFVQDNWNITDYFMLKLGLRYDMVRMKGGSNSINVPSQLNPAGGARGQFSNGKAREFNLDDMWAPRIGFTWDVMHNNKSKLYGFWGRYYERVPNDLAIRALTDEYFYFGYYSDAALTTPVSIAYAYGLYPTQTVGSPNYYSGPGGLPYMTPNLGSKVKGSYNDETILGFQYELAADFSVGVRGVYRSLGRAIEDISLDGGLTYIVTNPDQWTDGWAPDALGRTWAQWKFPKPTRIYKALEFTVDKRFSNNWQMGGSYVLSRLEGNYEGLYSNDNGQLDPNITSKYDIPSLLVNAYGLLPNDRTHNVKLYGSYHFTNIPLDLNAGFYLQSGTPISKLGADDAYGVNEGFAGVRGSAGRTPTIWWIDFGAQYTFKLGFSNLALRADIFNLTNEQRTTRVDQTYNEINTQDIQTNPYFKMETQHQRARRIRFAVRWTF